MKPRRPRWLSASLLAICSLTLAPEAVLQSPGLKRYAPVRPLPVKSPLPAEVAALLGWPKQDTYVPGAYQPK